MKRREFIILTGIGATTASMLSACGHPENKLIPALIPDDQYVPGLDYWKASSCALCEEGCGILVRTREHKANKIEGNLNHPVNRGGICARGQAGLQVLYAPDRISGPMKSTGQRGSARFEPISWDEATRLLAGRLQSIKEAKSDSILFATRYPHGVNRVAAMLLGDMLEGRLMWTDSRMIHDLGASYDETYGAPQPIFDIARASYILSFGARFLETWRSPMRYSKAYGEFRGSQSRGHGKFVQIEPRMSLTAANADEWIPARPGTESLLALALGAVISREKLVKADALPAFLSAPLERFAPEDVANQIDIPADVIIRLAREFAGSERPVALPGTEPHDTSSPATIAVKYLNELVGNRDKPGGVYYSTSWINSFDSVLHKIPRATLAKASTATNGLKDKGPLSAAAQAGRDAASSPAAFLLDANQVGALLVHHVNPVYTNPEVLERVKATPFIASFSCVMDETTQLADLILPDHTYLESWDVKPAPGVDPQSAAISILQPVVVPELDTRQTADVLLAVRSELGGAADLPFDSAESLVKHTIAELSKSSASGRPSTITEDTTDEPVQHALERGVLIVPAGAGRSTEPAFDSKSNTASRASKIEVPESPATTGESALTLISYETATFGMGGEAHLPVLQELPDPMTSVIWGNWVEISPQTAAQHGIADGELVEVSTEWGSIQVPAIVYPAIRSDVIAMPSGQGHTAFGRYATGLGANPALVQRGKQIVEAKISGTGKKAAVVRMGTMEREHPDLKR